MRIGPGRLEQIEIRLRRQVEEAHARYEAAHAAFDAIVRDAPADEPDTAARISEAGSALDAARQDFLTALQHMAAFTVSGGEAPQ